MCGGRAAGFTLVEVLIVIAIVVIILAVAVPAVNLLSGQRSIEGTQNLIAAELSLARSRAQSLQRPGGLVFYLDPSSQRIGMRHVTAAEVRATNGIVHRIDLATDSDPVLLPAGVAMQFLFPGDLPGGLSTSHRYIGFNALGGSNGAAFGGVVLFDAQGRVMVEPYQLPGDGPVADLFDLSGTPKARRSELGFVLMDRDRFTGQFDLDEDLGAYSAADEAEERWLDDNGRLLLLNRYNGTFVQ